MNPNPRVPFDDYQTFGMAFMIGYLGDVPDELQAAFPDQDEWRNRPDFIYSHNAHMWKRGYDCGVAFFSDHALEEE
jgi:hypothetical protein